MAKTLASGLLLLSGLVQAAQPSAPSPIPAPLRDLPWGQLNVLHTTDTHGWHAGHLQEPSYSADWGDYVSFAQRMKERADERGVDLLLVDTGDRVEGNGLYDASQPKGNFTSEIFKQQHIDVICSGNHELYKESTAYDEYLTTAPNFKGNYLASNLDILDPRTGKRVPLAPRYRRFTTKNQGIRVLAFGFLFDFTGNYNNSFVQPVEKTVEEEWFQDAIREKHVDLFLVAGHVMARSKEFATIHKAIREVQWDTPIAFFGGHAHIRDFTKYDAKSYAIASGRYMETIGFMSIDGLPTSGKKPSLSTASAPSFERRYIDNNLFSLHHHSGLNASTFPTVHGRNVSSYIADARTALGLDELYGCAPQNYWLNRAKYPGKDSMLTWLEEVVLPDLVGLKGRTDKATSVIINSGSMRFDIFKGAFSRDSTLIVSPFDGGFKFIRDIPADKAKKILVLLNNEGPVLSSLAERDSSALAPPEQMAITKDQTFEKHTVRAAPEGSHLVQQPLRKSDGGDADLPPGYTTKDDGGSTGDDTVHSPLSFYRVPNCIQSDVGLSPSPSPNDVVDLVFLDFVEPWILLALEFLGVELDTKKDVEIFAGGKSFTDMLEDWIKDNWGKDC